MTEFGMELSVDAKYELITRNLQEIIGGHNLKNVLQERQPIIYWGTAPTGSIHVCYILPLLKIKDFVDAGCMVTIFIADLHAFLDNLKTPFDKIEYRTMYYEKILKALLKILNVNMDFVKFVRGSEIQLNSSVMLDLLKLSSITKVSQGKKAGTAVVKSTDDPTVASILYPLLQALDEKYLDADAELGGVDQRKIFAYSRDYLKKIGITRKFTHLMNPIVSFVKQSDNTSSDNTLSDESINKMSSSDVSSKLDILDTPKKINSVINKLHCIDGIVEDNIVLYVIKLFVFPIKHQFDLLRKNENGGNKTFCTYEDLKLDVEKSLIHPADLKYSLSMFFIELLEPVRNEFSSEENKNLLKLAY